MKKIIVILGCAAILLSACGKKDNQNKAEEDNIENLKSYILANGGKIGNQPPEIQKALLKSLLNRLFNRGGK